MRDPMDDINPLKFLIVLIICVAFFLVQRHYYPDLRWYFPPSLVIIFGFFSLYFLGKSVWWKFRDGGYRVQVGGVSGSINGEPIQVKDPSKGKDFAWDLFPLGAVPPFKGKLGLLVVPHNQIYKTQGFYNGLTMTSRWNLFNLPAVVQQAIDNMPNEFNLDRIYFGEYSKDFIDNSGDEISLRDQLRAKDALISSLQKTNVNKFDHYEEIKNIVGKIGGDKNWFQKTLERLKKKDIEEE